MNKLSRCFECGRQINQADHSCRYCGTDYPAGVTCLICQERLPQSQAIFASHLRNSGYYHEYCLSENLHSSRPSRPAVALGDCLEPLAAQKQDKHQRRFSASAQAREPISVLNPRSYTGRLPLNSEQKDFTEEFDVQVCRSLWPYEPQPLSNPYVERRQEIARVFAKPASSRRRDATRILRPSHYRDMLGTLRQEVSRCFQRVRLRQLQSQQARQGLLAGYSAPNRGILGLFMFASLLLTSFFLATGNLWGGIFCGSIALYYLWDLLKSN